MDIINEVCDLLKQLRIKKPLVHSITNYVTVNDCANVILAIGASPIMADDINEASDITSISSALVINMGTLNKRTVESMLASGKRANELGIPVIFDPVGAGASKFRNETAKKIIEEVKINVLRGNLSEIRFISGLNSKAKGVDVSDSDLQIGNEEAIKIAESLAVKLNCTIAITGVEDIVSDGKRCVVLENGTKMLSKVTGTGCMTTALIGAYCGAGRDYFIGAAAGIISMSISGEIAEEKSGKTGLGSFHVSLIDAISNLDVEIFKAKARMNFIENKSIC